RSVENVIDEIEYFQKKYGIKEFAFMDDNFTFDEKRIYKFCYLLKKRNIKIYINLYPGVRADKLSWKMIRALKSVGVTRITVGVESGNQKVVMKIGKGLNLKDVLKAVHYTKKAGLVADGFFMLGLPMDTERTMHETISFAKKAGFDHAYFFVTTPFPGTPLYTLVERKGTFIAKYFLGIPKHIVEGQPVFIMGELTPELVSKKFKEAYLSFYFRIPKIIKLAKVYMTFMLRYFSFSEIKWLLSQFLFFFTKLHYKAPNLQDLLKSMKD
ncbi:MAG: B12-binding domain-containing radical SAM protein, partial [Promethearchaeota archaeon]